MEKKRKKIVIYSIAVLFSVLATIISLIFLLRYIPIKTRQLGQLHTGGKAMDVDVEGEIVYVVDMMDYSPGGLVIINISNPYNPNQIGSFL